MPLGGCLHSSGCGEWHAVWKHAVCVCGVCVAHSSPGSTDNLDTGSMASGIVVVEDHLHVGSGSMIWTRVGLTEGVP